VSLPEVVLDKLRSVVSVEFDLTPVATQAR
jgi:hypothetical protein